MVRQEDPASPVGSMLLVLCGGAGLSGRGSRQLGGGGAGAGAERGVEGGGAGSGEERGPGKSPCLPLPHNREGVGTTGPTFRAQRVAAVKGWRGWGWGSLGPFIFQTSRNGFRLFLKLNFKKFKFHFSKYYYANTLKKIH